MDITAILSTMGAGEGAQTPTRTPEPSGAFAAILAMLGEAHRIADAAVDTQPLSAAPTVASPAASAETVVVADPALVGFEANLGADTLGHADALVDSFSDSAFGAETPPAAPGDVDSEDALVEVEDAGTPAPATPLAAVGVPIIVAKAAGPSSGEATTGSVKTETETAASAKTVEPETTGPVAVRRAESVGPALAAARVPEPVTAAPKAAVATTQVEAVQDVVIAPDPGDVKHEPQETSARIFRVHADAAPAVDIKLPENVATDVDAPSKPSATVVAAPAPPVEGDTDAANAAGAPSKPSATVAAAPAPPIEGDVEAVPPEPADGQEPDVRTAAAPERRSDVSREFVAIARSHVRLVQGPAPGTTTSDEVKVTRPSPDTVAVADDAGVDAPKTVRVDRTLTETVATLTESKSEAAVAPNARQWASDLRAAVVRRAAQAVAPDASGAHAASAPKPASETGALMDVMVPDAPAVDADAASGDSGDALSSGDQRSSADAAPTAAQDRVRPASVEVEFSTKVEAAVRSDSAASAQAPATPVARAAAPTAPVQVIEQSAPVDLGDFVVRHVRVSSSDGTQTWTVRLVPESLGELRVEVSTHDSQVSVRLLTPSGEVRERLEGQIHRLHEALAREGIEVTRVVVASQPSAGAPLMASDANGHAGRGHQAPQPNAQGQPAEHERGWNSQGDSSSRDGHPRQRRPRSAFDVWA